MLLLCYFGFSKTCHIALNHILGKIPFLSHRVYQIKQYNFLSYFFDMIEKHQILYNNPRPLG